MSAGARWAWVSVEDKLPATDDVVLWHTEAGGVFEAFLHDDGDEVWLGSFLDGGPISGRVTHWVEIQRPEVSGHMEVVG